MRRAGLIVAVVVPLAILSGVSACVASGGHHLVLAPLTPSRPSASFVSSCPVPAPRLARPYVGVAPGAPWQAATASFTSAVKEKPQIIEDYVAFGSPFDTARACEVTRLGALPLVQLNPGTTSLAAIVSGRYDSYLRSYARAVSAFRLPVAVSFAHEMNARWFPWGYKHVRPRVFIAAWRHIHDVMGTAHNVTWVWNPNRANKRVPWAISPPRRWWPGRAYVDWIGIDAYFNSPADTFGSVFGATLANVSGLGAPVLVTETAVAASPQQSRQIQSLVTGVRRHSLLGFVWFDITEREHWYLEDRPAAIAAFRKAAGGR